LSDLDLSVATAYGVAMLDEDIAIPATFIITQGGLIHFKKVGETQADRADLDDVLTILDQLLAQQTRG
jgi:peroxiredoxin